MNSLLNKGFDPSNIRSLIQELAWRDYFQQVWKIKGERINTDIKNKQTDVKHYEIPCAIMNGETGIKAIDDGIQNLYKMGYMHNHLRMYVSSIACNVGGSHWKTPATWMYYHLLDGDWASNTLSWQWIAGTFSNKKYYANQDNINKYCYTNQKNTFLDLGYDDFNSMSIPEILKKTCLPDLYTNLPDSENIHIDKQKPTLIYNSYNLDPEWKKHEDLNRVLLFEPTHFAKYPVSKNIVSFILSLARNIPDIQIYTGEFDDLITNYEITDIFFKEHPANRHYKGKQERRDWMFSIEGYYPSFFKFWKECEKELKKN
jgi:deoxyribodipyrimidine photo-lyase